MSLDLWLEKPKCPTCNHSDYTNNENYTYNVANMWYEIFPDDGKMIEIDDMTGEKSLEKLRVAYDVLIKNPKKFIPLNPKNGWGNYDGFMMFIKTLIDMAIEHPTWIWKSSR